MVDTVVAGAHQIGVEYAAMASQHLWRASGGISTSHIRPREPQLTRRVAGRPWRRKRN